METTLRRTMRINSVCILLDILLCFCYSLLHENILAHLLFNNQTPQWYAAVETAVGTVSVYAAIVVLIALVVFTAYAIHASIHSSRAHFEPPERLRNGCILSGALAVIWMFLFPFYLRYWITGWAVFF